MSLDKRYGPMFHVASRAIKYYLLGVFGFAVVCSLAGVMGMFGAIEPFLPDIISFLLRLAALLIIFMATAVVIESLRR